MHSTTQSPFPFLSGKQLGRGFRRPLERSRCSESHLQSSYQARLRQRRADTGFLPSLELSREKAVALQLQLLIAGHHEFGELQVLQTNNQPWPDHGVELLYRFSAFDPFIRSKYFGRSLDLGQFERFRRVFHTPEFQVLLCHTEHHLLSSLQVSETQWKQRVEVQGFRTGESGRFTFTMIQRVGGHFDGLWFTESLHPETHLQIPPM